MDKLWEGRDVELEIIERFARGMRLNVNEWREYWGYPPVESAEESGDAILGAGIRELQEKYDAPFLTVRRWKGRGELTPDEARELLREIEDDLLREMEEERAEKEG